MSNTKKSPKRRAARDTPVQKKGMPLRPLDLTGAEKTDLRIQFAALPYRMHKGKPEVMLVTSRRTQRWILPKGWPHHGMTPAQSAAQEALEEAGVEGKAFNTGLGLYSYEKQGITGTSLPCVAMVYPLKVKHMHDIWREKAQRRRRWFSPAKAARRVDEPELAFILRTFDPRKLT